MAKRLTRKLTDVAREVEIQLKAHFEITQNQNLNLLSFSN